MVWYGMVWYGVAWYDMIRYGMVTAPLVVPVVTRVREDNQAIVSLAADDAADALRALPDRVERKKVALSNLIDNHPQNTQPRQAEGDGRGGEEAAEKGGKGVHQPNFTNI